MYFMHAMYLYIVFLLLSFRLQVIAGGGCGHRPPAMRIINGVDARPNSWPWQVSVSMGRQHLCGGALIRPNWVLTAAHCVNEFPYPDVYEVIVGAHQLYGKTPVQQMIEVQEVFFHNRFSEKHYKNDIALLKLKRPVLISEKVNTVCLPTKKDGEVRVDKWCYVTGWGRTYNNGPQAEYLQEAGLIVVGQQECNEKNKNLLPVERNSMLCAGRRSKGGCQGDSGGPLVCEENGRWLVRGVVSWGSRDCSTKYFTVFARVSNYRRWINRIISENSGGSGGAGGGGGGGGTGSGSCHEVSQVVCNHVKNNCNYKEVRKICPKTCGVCKK